jgi:hypothetical protein
MSEESEPQATKGKGKGGRPRYRPTDHDRRQVRMMAGMGLTHLEISAVMEISAPTLRRYFRIELDVGPLEANAQVAASLYRQATDKARPNVVAAIFWLKCRAGWRDHDTSVLGKKEQQVADAREIADGRRFAPGAAPPALKLVK